MSSELLSLRSKKKGRVTYMNRAALLKLCRNILVTSRLKLGTTKFKLALLADLLRAKTKMKPDFKRFWRPSKRRLSTSLKPSQKSSKEKSAR